ncbi:MAG: DUF2878 domain-containing protein [Flavobacteriaceae bacterium]|nr:DUF2878 domain-containing protein [Flavobacteriaceae bacterium]
MKNIINFILFQSLWLSCIIGAAYQNIWPATICLTALMLLFLLPKYKNGNDILFIYTSVTLGFLLDSLLAYTGLIEYKLNFGLTQTAPLWILFLWIGFALTLNHSMSWLLNKPKLGTLFITIGAPLSYFSAEKLNAIKINQTLTTLLLVSLLWLLVYKIILTINNSIENNQELEHA